MIDLILALRNWEKPVEWLFQGGLLLIAMVAIWRILRRNSMLVDHVFTRSEKSEERFAHLVGETHRVVGDLKAAIDRLGHAITTDRRETRSALTDHQRELDDHGRRLHDLEERR